MARRKQLILDEEAYAINEMTSGDKVVMDKTYTYDMTLIARYMYQVMNKKPKEIKAWLFSWLKHRDIKYKDFKWEETVDHIVGSELKKPLFVSDGIPIFQGELDAINTIERKPLRRILFTMLCLAKYQNQKSGTNNDVIFFDMKTIFGLSNTSMTANQKLDAIRILRETGLIAPLVDEITNSGTKVCFVNYNFDYETPITVITNLNDLGYQYEQLCGAEFDECILCGRLIRKQGDQHRKYCNYCKVTYGLEDNSRFNKGRRKLVMVKCEDCGCDFVIDSRAFGEQRRCESCQKKYILDKQRTRRLNS